MENVEAEAEFEEIVTPLPAREFKRTEQSLEYTMQDAYSTMEAVEV